MIKSFKCKETEKIFRRLGSRKFGAFQKVAMRKLLLLEAAGRLEDLKVPLANRLEKLRGNREGQYSIRINNQWRICFCWKEGNVTEVEIIDYH